MRPAINRGLRMAVHVALTVLAEERIYWGSLDGEQWIPTRRAPLAGEEAQLAQAFHQAANPRTPPGSRTRPLGFRGAPRAFLERMQARFWMAIP